MRSFNKRRGVLGQWAIAILVTMVLAFLMSVAPVSGDPYCGDTCSGEMFVKQGEKTETQKAKVCQVRINGKIKTKWAIKTKVCNYGWWIKKCVDNDWCKNTKKCAFLKNLPDKQIRYSTSCSPWKITYVVE
jgi:hypothetical protein